MPDFAFDAVAVLLILLSLVALLRIGVARLESSIGVLRDGLPVGSWSPRWSGEACSGDRVTIPRLGAWQVVMFASHGLVQFPTLISAMNDIDSRDSAEVTCISPFPRELCEAANQALGLKVPVVCNQPQVYELFRVRVRPFVFIIGPDGRVAWQGLVNTGDQLLHMLRMAQSVQTPARLPVGA